MGYPTLLNATEKKMVLMDTCAITSNWITSDISVATHTWPKPDLHFPEIPTELRGESLKLCSSSALYVEESVLYLH